MGTPPSVAHRSAMTAAIQRPAPTEMPEAKKPRTVDEDVRARIEWNRQLALERKRRLAEGAPMPGASAEATVEPRLGAAVVPSAPVADGRGLSAEQLARAERNRQAALQRRQLRATPSAAAVVEEGLPSAPAPPSQRPLAVAEAEQAAGGEESADATGSPAELPVGGLEEDEESSETTSPISSLSLVLGEDSDDEEGEETSSSDSEGSSSSASSSSASSARSGAGDGAGPDSDMHGESSSEESMHMSDVEQQPKMTEEAVKARIERNRRLALERRRLAQEKAQMVPPKPPGERNKKQNLVAKLLCRWWYVMPDWPPQDMDWAAALERQGCRCVPVEAMHMEPEYDERGLRKVFAVADWPGLYRDEQGRLVDVRPVEGRPSYDQFMKRSELELFKLLMTAYERQLAELEAQPGSGVTRDQYRQELQREMREMRGKCAFVHWFKQKPSGADTAAAGA